MNTLRIYMIASLFVFVSVNLMISSKDVKNNYTSEYTLKASKPIKIVNVGGNGFRKDIFTTSFKKGECLPEKECVLVSGKMSDDADMYVWDAAFLGTTIDRFKVPKTKKLTGLIDGEPKIETKKISEGRSKFDITIDYRKDSTIRWTFVKTLIDNGMLFHEPAPLNQKENVIVFVNRNCHTMSHREKYVKEIMDIGIVPVKSYGNCLKNSELSKNIEPSFILDPKDKNLAGKYGTFHFSKFCIAIENSVITSYNSEKLWHALAWGCVPIYLGDTEIDHYLPTRKERMYIDIKDFNYNMTALSLHVKFLMNNDVEYNKMLEWKTEIPTSPGWFEWKEINRKDVRCEM